ncbi:MAG: DeoR family transcriptional regulator [Candidatus Niyogibacteria bacterium]|nr:DeoR family transcriptional regulator [Candidatus Niyogibacteria bacterium]
MSGEKNGHLEQIYERSQKLTEALYRVTDLFSDSEPLKWFLRREGLEIFESLLKIRTLPHGDRVRGLSQISGKMRLAVKVFELAASGSFISEANFRVLKREYSDLADYLAERQYEILPEPSAEGFIGQSAIRQLSDKDNGHNAIKSSEAEPEEISNGSKQVLSGGNGNNNSNSNGNGERRQEIISLIKEKDWTSVGEIAEVFKGRISEKTLQRDLVSMAGEGLLLKEGEKRWRKYKLASESEG